MKDETKETDPTSQSQTIEQTQSHVDTTDTTGNAPDSTVTGEDNTPDNTTATAAHSDGTTVILTTDNTDTSVENAPVSDTSALMATASPDGKTRIMIPAEGDDTYVHRDELQALLEAAYMKGRNEAVKAQIIADTSTLMPTAIDGLAPDLADLFATRRSVWDSSNAMN